MESRNGRTCWVAAGAYPTPPAVVVHIVHKADARAREQLGPLGQSLLLRVPPASERAKEWPKRPGSVEDGRVVHGQSRQHHCGGTNRATRQRSAAAPAERACTRSDASAVSGGTRRAARVHAQRRVSGQRRHVWRHAAVRARACVVLGPSPPLRHVAARTGALHASLRMQIAHKLGELALETIGRACRLKPRVEAVRRQLLGAARAAGKRQAAVGSVPCHSSNALGGQ